MSTHFKSAHRARAGVRVGRGNHEAFAVGLVPLRGWHPIEILHFPVRSLRALHPQVRHAVRRARAERREGHSGAHGRRPTGPTGRDVSRTSTRPLVVDDERARASDLRTDELVVDTRLRDALRSARVRRGRARHGSGSSASPSVDDGAAFAAECSPYSRSRTVASRLPRGSAGSSRGSRRSSRALPLEPGVRCGSGAAAMSRRFAAVARVRSRHEGRPLALFLLAFVVFWIESLGWPMAKGRDTWDYLAYYLQLLDSEPPLAEAQVFRTPVTPIVVGGALDLGGTIPPARDRVRAPVRDRHRGAWSVVALTVRSHPGALHRSAPARLPRLRNALPPGVERRRLRHRHGGLGPAPRARAVMRRRAGDSLLWEPGSQCSC